jgi:hypothetical protein
MHARLAKSERAAKFCIANSWWEFRMENEERGFNQVVAGEMVKC